MAKKCSSCGFTNNPDDAHYCGKCGQNIAAYGYTWKLYNYSQYTAVPDSKLKEYRQYEERAKASFWKKIGYSFSGLWTSFLMWWKEYALGTAAILGGGIFMAAAIIGLGSLVYNFLNNSNTISRIEVKGKYGIGYDTDKLLVPAIYDSISPKALDNQWVLYHKSVGTVGVAYVTDSVQRIIKPVYTEVKQLGRFGPIVLKDRNNNYWFSIRGEITNQLPFASVSCIERNNPQAFIVKHGSGYFDLISKEGKALTNEQFSQIIVDEDSVIRAKFYKSSSNYGCKLFDYNGYLLTNKTFQVVDVFSDGVAWCTVDRADLQNSQRSVIDRQGNLLFSISPTVSQTKFSDGIGFYRTSWSSYQYIAVDKSGKKLFTIKAQSVLPYTMGIAPVYKGKDYSDRKMGFIDKNGRTVIPFKYVATYHNPYFNNDGLMEVSLDGVQGKLHRNGVFTPNK